MTGVLYQVQKSDFVLGTLYLVHDGGCELCRRLGQWVQRSDRRGRLRAVTFDDPLAGQLLSSLPRDQWPYTFHVVQPDGRVISGDAALPILVGLMAGWGPLAWLLRCPGVGRLAGVALYRWLASQHESAR